MLLANGAILGHVASGLAHEPDGREVDGLRFTGANEAGIGGGHDWIRWTDYFSIFAGGRAQTGSGKGKGFNTGDTEEHRDPRSRRTDAINCRGGCARLRT